ncbi:hypothetical protein OPV22_025153 [Ensete ventricosum]|uniref:Secreted protein n=1 Tax=Ensete ventricosum TaxID=4639 RepID=A0AAV8QGV2_ENSVE|nr:hypothetical protein OPV22_025153 [Ensete ventricosum]
MRVALFSLPLLPTFPNLASGFGRRAVVLLSPPPIPRVFLPCDWPPSGSATHQLRGRLELRLAFRQRKRAGSRPATKLLIG